MHQLRRFLRMVAIALPWSLLLGIAIDHAQGTSEAEPAKDDPVAAVSEAGVAYVNGRMLSPSGTPLNEPALNVNPKTQLPPGVVARVEDAMVTAEEVLARIYALEGVPDSGPRRLPVAYQYLINLRLLELEAQRQGVEIDEDLRIKLTELMIARAKRENYRQNGGALPWKRFISSLNMSENEFRDRVYERVKPMMLKHYLVRLFELQSDNVSFSQILFRERASADTVLRQIEEHRGLVTSGKADLTMREFFQRKAILESTTREGNSQLYAGEPEDPDLIQALFTDLQVDGVSGIIELGEGARRTYGIFMLLNRRVGVALAFEDLREQLDKELVEFFSEEADDKFRQQGVSEPVNDNRYKRWVKWTLAKGMYNVAFRYPGAPIKGGDMPTRGTIETKTNEGGDDD